MERSWAKEQPVASYEVSLSGEDGSNTIQLDINALANMPNTAAATPNDDASSAFTVSALSGLVSRANTRCRASCTVQPNY